MKKDQKHKSKTDESYENTFYKKKCTKWLLYDV